jgi:hypothetical protein
MAKRGKIGMVSSIPYGRDVYELSGVEYCELEDRLEAIAEDDTEGYERVVCQFLREHGYEVEAPESIKPERKAKGRAVDALYANATRASGEQPRPQRFPPTRDREEKVMAQLMKRAKQQPQQAMKQPANFGFYFFIGVICFIVLCKLTPQRPLNLPPAPNAASTYIYATKEPPTQATGANTGKESPNVTTGKTAKKHNEKYKDAKPSEVLPSEPLLHVIPSVPAPYVYPVKKGVKLPELLKAKPPTEFY